MRFFVPNETELEILTNKSVNTIGEIKEAAHLIGDKGVKNVIVTMGSKGLLWINKDEEHFIKARKVDAVDTTGAGDGFIAHYYVATKTYY